jgi:iron complex outermembrane receptor protein
MDAMAGMDRARVIGRTLLIAAVVAAGTMAAGGAAAAQPAAERRIGFHIGAQDLNGALIGFAQQAGVQVLYDSSRVEGLRSTAVDGEMTPGAALARLLAGTGLTYRFTSPDTVSLTAAPAEAGSVMLPPVRAGADAVQETAYGPVAGYVARRSATGTKSDTPIVATPQSISVVTRGQIEVMNAQTVDQALRYTAGIEAESRANFSGFDFVYGRGFVLDRYLDGLKLQGAAGYLPPAVDIYDIEKVEVLRGPSSVLYGQASPGGLVNMVSKMPTADPVRELVLQGGSRNDFEGAFDLGGPIDRDGHFLYRLTGLAHTADSQVDYTRAERLSISPAFTWAPDADTSLTVLTNFQRDPRVGLYNFVPATGTILPNPNGRLPRTLYAGDPDFNTIERTQYSLGTIFEHRFDDVWSVRQNFRYMHSGGALDQVLPVFMLDDRALFRYALSSHENLDAVSLDNQAQARFATGPLQHTVLFGLDYQYTSFRQRLGEGLGVADLDLFAPVYGVGVPPPDTTMDNDQSQNQLGLYVQDQIRLDRLALLLGGRQDWAHSTTTDNLAAAVTRQSDRKFSYRAGLVYLFDNGLAPYFSYSTSFQPQAGTGAGGDPFKPTTAQQYEAGLKFQPPGSESLVTLSAYHLKQQNVLTTDPDDPAFQTQTGEIRSRGIEVEALLNLLPGLFAGASYGYNDPVVTRSNTGNVGMMPVNLPKNLASLWMDYRAAQGPLAGLGLRAGVHYVGHTFGDPENTLTVPSYVLVDAGISYDLSGLGTAFRDWQLAVNVNNLLDKHYVSECSNDAYCLYGPGRSVLVVLRLKS